MAVLLRFVASSVPASVTLQPTMVAKAKRPVAPVISATMTPAVIMMSMTTARTAAGVNGRMDAFTSVKPSIPFEVPVNRGHSHRLSHPFCWSRVRRSLPGSNRTGIGMNMRR